MSSLVSDAAVLAETHAGGKFAAGGDPMQRTAFVVPAQRHTFLSRQAAAARFVNLRMRSTVSAHGL
jgi:hypothetical protein